MKHAPGFLRIVDEARKHVREVDIYRVRSMLEQGEDFELIDVREDAEWTAGHLPGARHLGKGVIERDIETAIPDRDRPLVLYCGGGYRSALAADAIQRMGYRNVLSMDGGFRAWSEAGYPVATE